MNRVRHKLSERCDTCGNDHLVKKVLGLWDQQLDTYDISRIIFETEAEVARTLRRGLEQRRLSDD